MDFELDHEQRLLRDSVNRLLDDHYSFADRQRYLAAKPGWSRGVWRHYADLGLLAVACHDGEASRDGLVHLMLMMEAQGRVLALEPYIASVVHCGSLLRLAGTPAQRSALLPALEAGTRLLALAHGEAQARYDLADVATAARRDGTGWRLTGAKSLVPHGDTADTLLVSARLRGARRDADGIGLFTVTPDAPGVAVLPCATYDGHRAADIVLTDVAVTADDMVGPPGDALPLLEHAAALGIVAVAAEAVGCMQALLDITVDYMNTREQFGRPIGTLQALRHRAVDMLVAVEQARSMTYYATMMAADADPLQRARAIAATKVQVGKSARLVGQGAIQLHGGIGMTMEYKAGHYFKRLTAIESQFGDVDHHLQRLAAMGGIFAAAS
jgi:pimeloyl-CoA dehydrogenase small subunit